MDCNVYNNITPTPQASCRSNGAIYRQTKVLYLPFHAINSSRTIVIGGTCFCFASKHVRASLTQLWTNGYI